MRKLLLASVSVIALRAAEAQTIPPPGIAAIAGAYLATPPTCNPGYYCQIQVDVNGNLKTTGSFSATITGFTPNGNYATLAVTTTTANVLMPVGATVIVYNTGASAVFVKLGVAGVTVTPTTGDQVAPGGALALTVGANTTIAAITAAGTSSINLSAGTGIWSGTGGGGGGGSGGAVTIANGADGALGNTADAPYAGGGGAASVVAALKGVYNAITISSLPAGTNSIGGVTEANGANIALGNTADVAYGGSGTSSVVAALKGIYAATVANAPANQPYQPSTTTGNIAAANTTGINLKTTSANLYGAQLSGIGAVPAYVKIYDLSTVPVCGSGTPIKRLMIPAAPGGTSPPPPPVQSLLLIDPSGNGYVLLEDNSSRVILEPVATSPPPPPTTSIGAIANATFGPGVKTVNGLGYCVTLGIADNDSTAPPAATYLVNLDWK